MLVGNAIFLGAAAVGFQHQFQAVFILIGIGCRFLKIVVRAICIFPHIVGRIHIPLIDSLVKIGTPAVSHAEIIAAGIVGIIGIAGYRAVVEVIHVADGYRHQIAAKADVAANPGQIAGVVIHGAGACPSGRGAGVVPVTLHAVIIAEHDGQCRLQVTVVHRTELLDIMESAFFMFLRHLEHNAGITFGIPFTNHLGNVPGIPIRSGNNAIVFNGIVIIRLILPGHGTGSPGGLHLMGVDLHILAACMLIQG